MDGYFEILIEKLRNEDVLTQSELDDLYSEFVYDEDIEELLGGGRVRWFCVIKVATDEYYGFYKITSDYEATDYETEISRVYPKPREVIFWEDEP